MKKVDRSDLITGFVPAGNLSEEEKDICHAMLSIRTAHVPMSIHAAVMHQIGTRLLAMPHGLALIKDAPPIEHYSGTVH